MSPPENAELSRWTGSAPYWEKHRDLIRHMFGPITNALLGDAEVRSGDAVLDVATGAGDPALSVAEAVGPSGSVVGIDPAAPMIEGARRAAADLGIKNARFEIASAEALPFPAATFDAVICRFGVMFFPTPVAGVREMLRVLKPGKKISFAAWHFLDNNPFHHSMARVVDRYVAPISLPPDAPDAFRFAAPGKLARVLVEAGVAEPTERILRFSIDAPLSAEDFWTMRCEWSQKLSEKISQLPAEQSRAVRDEVFQSFNKYQSARGLSFPAEVLVVSGTKRQARVDV